ncbi:MAG: dihydropteroate synthase, partial [Phycisphaeraceae bacterium]|nr:dihydropteroate synthase [Phycisphaeraceae bacterium]
ELGRWGKDDQLPIFVSVTIEQMGTMLVGSDVGAAVTSINELPIAGLGMNCATGPKEMTEHLRHLSAHSPARVTLFPNAGLPSLVEGETVFPMTPDSMAEQVAELVEEFGVNLVGGCCGTTPEHLAAVVKAVGERSPAKRKIDPEPGVTSIYQSTPYRQEASLLNIGERCNASGSRRFKRLLEEEDWDEIVSLAREQMKEGSHVLDINVDYAGRDNAADMDHLVSLLVRQVDAPLMIDATDPKVMEAGLRRAGGKCLINSANLEDGEEKFDQVLGLASKYGAGVVLGSIDEDPEEAMARTADRKLSIAERMYELATERHGLDPADLMFDPLVLPVSTGMEKDKRSGLETIEGTRRIAERFPECQITCGLSNISFGLNPAARQVLNSVFLHELREAGMTSAILHVSKIMPRTRIEDEHWEAALDVLYAREAEAPVELEDGSTTRDPLQIFIDLFPADATAQSMKQDLSELELEERLQRHIIDGEKKNLEATLDEAMEKYPPLEIINDHLLGGMKVVGELFGSGQMQLPFVLQSAEVMKMAVAHLEPHMEKEEGQ